MTSVIFYIETWFLLFLAPPQAFAKTKYSFSHQIHIIVSLAWRLCMRVHGGTLNQARHVFNVFWFTPFGCCCFCFMNWSSLYKDGCFLCSKCVFVYFKSSSSVYIHFMVQNHTSCLRLLLNSIYTPSYYIRYCYYNYQYTTTTTLVCCIKNFC